MVHFFYLHVRSSHGGGATDTGGYHHCYYTSQQQFASDYVMSQAGLNSSNMVVGNGHEVALCTASGCRQTSHNTSQMAPGGVAGTVDHVHNNSQNQARTLGLLFNSLLKQCMNHPNSRVADKGPTLPTPRDEKGFVSWYLAPQICYCFHTPFTKLCHKSNLFYNFITCYRMTSIVVVKA